MDGIQTGIGRFALLVIDCPDPPALGGFDAGLLGPAGHPFCLVTVTS